MIAMIHFGFMIAMIHFGFMSHWVRGNTLITIFFVGWVRGRTLITLLFLLVFNKLRAKTVEEVDDGYLNP